MNPKTKFRFLFGALMMAFSSCGLYATSEIVDDEESANYLAAHIAASSGGSTDQYIAYSRKLAQTLDQLDVAAQQRVFDPTNANGGGDSTSNGEGGDSGEEGGDSGEEGGDGGEEGGSSFWERFWNWLRGLFD